MMPIGTITEMKTGVL